MLTRYCDSNQLYVRASDVSAIIKHFSVQIQQRLHEIEKPSHQYFDCISSSHHNTSSEESIFESEIISRYHSYSTRNPEEIKLLDRLCQRILQIYDYFKQECVEPAALIALQERIHFKLKEILKTNHSLLKPPSLKVRFGCKRQKFQLLQTADGKTSKNRSTFYKDSKPVSQKNNLRIDPSVENSATNSQIYISTPTQVSQFGNSSNSSGVEVEVGVLFKFIFSTLKKGYLMRLKMDKRLKRSQDENQNRISVTGTGTVLRCFSEKNKENLSNQKKITQLKTNFKAGKNNGQPYFSYINSKGARNKIFRNQLGSNLGRNSSVYIDPLLGNATQNSFFGGEGSSLSKQIRSREIEKRLEHIYEDLLSYDKYFVLRVIKNQEELKKDALRRNQGIFRQRKKYTTEYGLNKTDKRTLTKKTLLQNQFENKVSRQVINSQNVIGYREETVETRNQVIQKEQTEEQSITETASVNKSLKIDLLKHLTTENNSSCSLKAEENHCTEILEQNLHTEGFEFEDDFQARKDSDRNILGEMSTNEIVDKSKKAKMAQKYKKMLPIRERDRKSCLASTIYHVQGSVTEEDDFEDFQPIGLQTCHQAVSSSNSPFARRVLGHRLNMKGFSKNHAETSAFARSTGTKKQQFVQGLRQQKQPRVGQQCDSRAKNAVMSPKLGSLFAHR